MKWLFGGSPLFRRILASILLASVFFLSLLSLVVYYSNEILEDELLTKQTDFELRNIKDLLARDANASLPNSANLSIYLASRQADLAVPEYLVGLADGVHHDLQIADKAYHVLIVAHDGDRIYIQSDITEIERSEELLGWILLVAWIVLIVLVFIIARILSKKLSEPIAELSRELSQINPDQRGIQLSHRFANDEFGKIAQAFDHYSEKIDDYVEKQMAFAAMASHELRSPLTIVQTSADLITSRTRDPSIKPQLEKINRATAGMANMIHALLAVTRDSPSRNPEQDVDLQALVNEILDSMNAEIDAKQLRIENRLSAQPTLSTDPTLAKVVLTNLIKNSVKHSEHSSIEITMRQRVLSIIDHGIGIDETALQDIFDFGFRGHNSQGYGVGLYISKLVCDYQGWRLTLRSNPQGGSIATVDFGA